MTGGNGTTEGLRVAHLTTIDMSLALLLAAGAGLCMYLVIFLHLPDLLTVIIQVVVGLGIYLTGSAILELDTFEYFKDVLAPSIRQKLKR